MNTENIASVPMSNQVTLNRYWLLALLSFLNMINFIDRQLLSSFANFIVPDLGLTNSQFGLLTGIVFLAFYAIMGLFMGALADNHHRPRLIGIAIFTWSALTAASGAAKGFLSLAIPRVFIAVGESVLTPASISMLADKFPVEKRGVAAGLYYIGVPIGFGLSLLIAGYLGPLIGWRMCFYSLGAIGVILSILMFCLSDVPRRQQPRSDKPLQKNAIRKNIRSLWSTLKASPALCFTIAGGVSMHFIFGATTYDQLWYVQERGFERAFIAQATGWIGVFGGVLGSLFGGFVSDILLRYFNKSRLLLLFWMMLVLAPISIYYRIADPSSFLFWLGVFITFFQLGAMYGPILSTLQELAPPQICATVVAFYILMTSLVGVGSSITASGFLIDYFIATGMNNAYTVSMIIFTTLSFLAIPAFYFANRYLK